MDFQAWHFSDHWYDWINYYTTPGALSIKLESWLSLSLRFFQSDILTFKVTEDNI